MEPADRPGRGGTVDKGKAMVTQTGDRYAAIWRPVFAAGYPAESTVTEAWAQTRQMFAETYGPGLTDTQQREMAGEMTVAWLLRALSPAATAVDTERATLAQQAALWLGLCGYDLDRIYDGYYQLLQGWGVYG
jgi:hypothetical protein